MAVHNGRLASRSTLVLGSITAALLFGIFTFNDQLSAVQRKESYVRPVITGKQPYEALNSHVWRKSWGSNCSDTHQASTGTHLLCRLPSIWQNCTNGIYLDVGTNVGVQLRKLYDPWQFPGAPVLELFTKTFGVDRNGVCAIGVEANPKHTTYLTALNAYFRRKGYQVIVLTETAAATKSGYAEFHTEPNNRHELGASLGSARWKWKSFPTKQVPLLDLPAFIAQVVKPLAVQIEGVTGKRPALGMKMDVEGEEYALLPALITSGGLCDLDMVYIEPHSGRYRTEDGQAVGYSLKAMESMFQKLRKANPHCAVQYSHLDDESYLQADIQVPLMP